MSDVWQECSTGWRDFRGASWVQNVERVCKSAKESGLSPVDNGEPWDDCKQELCTLERSLLIAAAAGV